MTKIKVCGLFREEDIQYVNYARPDYAGFIIDFPKSHRSITPKRAAELIKILDQDIKAVGVFVNQPINQLIDMINESGIHMVQLHGDEDEQYIQILQSKINIPVIKAFQIYSKNDLVEAEKSKADYILLDSGKGCGKCFDWSLLNQINRPFFLAGGLTPDNLSDAIKKVHPMAVDLSSGVETEKIKDHEKIEKVVAITRQNEKED